MFGQTRHSINVHTNDPNGKFLTVVNTFNQQNLRDSKYVKCVEEKEIASDLFFLSTISVCGKHKLLST